MDNERSIERYFVEQVRAAGGWPLKLSCPGTAGMPDRLVLWHDGVCEFVELKAPGRRPRALQISRAHQLMGLGFGTFLVSSQDDVESYVDRALRRFAR